MHPFFETVLDFLRHNPACPDCGDQLWCQYGEGHMWFDCHSCKYPSKDWLSPAAYVSTLDVPSDLIPDELETKRSNTDPRFRCSDYYRKRETPARGGCEQHPPYERRRSKRLLQITWFLRFGRSGQPRVIGPPLGFPFAPTVRSPPS